MLQSRISGIGIHLPETTVTNDDLSKIMDTSDAWITERTGIKERRYARKKEDTSATMGAAAAKMAIENAGITPQDIDFIIFATLSPDYFFPGCAVLVQRMLNMHEVGALDIRNQCSGFVYGLSIADQFIKTGMYKNILLIGAEVQSYLMDFSTRGRNISVIFGDAAGAVVLQPSTKEGHGILSTHLHSDGRDAEQLSMINPGSHAGHYNNFSSNGISEIYGGGFITDAQKESHDFYPVMDGPAVFKKAAEKFPEVVAEALKKNGYTTQDLQLLITHQANIRISQMVQHKLHLRDKQVYNNIQQYGNTTAASVPLALYEAWQKGLIKDGDLVCLAAFGSGYTWGSALIKW